MDNGGNRGGVPEDRTETGEDDAPESTPRLSLPQLQCLYTAGQPLTHRPAHVLTSGATPLGRAHSAEPGIHFEDHRLSRRHATLLVGPDQSLSIRDEGSKNGTAINRQPLRPHQIAPLQDGDLLRVGDTVLLVRQQPLQAESRPADGDSLLGFSRAMISLRRDIARVAADRATVLILGETGTGKELVAQALHAQSGRKGPFVSINSSTIPEQLAESTLFGNTGHAYTGARAQPGLFRAAHGGTLFLDEIGELPLGLQPKLLRTLQEHTVLPVGAVKAEPCDVRVISATHRDVESLVALGSFRQDLYARLGTIVLRVPPLRERREDILLLLCHALGTNCPPLTAALAEALLLYHWPLNVRGLFQVAARLRLLGPDESILQLLRQSAAPETSPSPEALGALRGRPERTQLVALLEKHRWVQNRVAHELGCSRRQLARFMDHYKLPRSRTDGANE